MHLHRKLLLCALLSLLTAPALAEDAAQPAPRSKNHSWMSLDQWKALHTKNLERGKEGPVDLLFLGDSITQGWGNNAAWQKHYVPRKAGNFGIGGDTTQNVLWRITTGDELVEIKPKVVVLLIGTNNFGLDNHQPADVARGVEAILQTLQEKLPEAKILLLAIFPRDQQPDTDFRKRIAAANEQLAKFADRKGRVTFLDLGPKFLLASGELSKDLMPDYLHLSDKGYNVWVEAMEPTLAKLLGE